MRRRFFVESFENGSAILRGDTAHHLGRVLRAEPGQLYELSDGVSVWLARTERVEREAVCFTLIEPVAVRTPRWRITLLLAIVKFDRFEWSLEKASELGADEIVPLAAERSERGLIAASAKRAERWKRILVESAQQSRRLRIPELAACRAPQESFRAGKATVQLLLSERPGVPSMRAVLDASLAEIYSGAPDGISMAIGPEGGWTDGELQFAANAGFSEVSLGSNILRTETAVCAALGAMQYALGDG